MGSFKPMEAPRETGNMESITWSVDWNPEFADEAKLKREVMRALNEPKTIAAVKRFAETAAKEATADGLETEHILWLDSGYAHAFFVRVWYELGEGKLFILVEENDLGDIGFVLIEKLDCASYTSETNVLRVELTDPEDLGVAR